MHDCSQEKSQAIRQSGRTADHTLPQVSSAITAEFQHLGCGPVGSLTNYENNPLERSAGQPFTNMRERPVAHGAGQPVADDQIQEENHRGDERYGALANSSPARLVSTTVTGSSNEDTDFPRQGNINLPLN